MSGRVTPKRQQAARRTPPPPTERPWLNLTETAEWYALHPRTITRMIKAGEIPAHVVRPFGRSIRINRVELDKWFTDRNEAA